MIVKENTVIFEVCDMAFVKKFGIAQATEMVLDYKSVNPLPFLYDTYQAAKFLGVGRLTLFQYAKNPEQGYKLITLKKRSGDKRRIYAPDIVLKHLQTGILRKILIYFPVSPYATAYSKNCTLRNNAAPHVGKKHLLKLDITDFFGSIRFDQVYSAAFNTRYFPKQIGVILTSLCCREEALPQGAPTSPALSNLVMRNFDNSLGRWCQKRGIAYTRYCDDMTFSSDKPLYPVYEKVKSMLYDMGFTLNEKKTRFVTSAGRQSVTGLTVNEKVAVSSEYKRKLRQEIYYALKFGLEDSIRFAKRTEFMRDGVPDAERYAQHLIGKANYVLQIEPENRWFREALERLQWTLKCLEMQG